MEEMVPGTEEKVPWMKEMVPGTEEKVPWMKEMVPGTEEKVKVTSTNAHFKMPKQII
jgi:hypothetical protein